MFEETLVDALLIDAVILKLSVTSCVDCPTCNFRLLRLLFRLLHLLFRRLPYSDDALPHPTEDGLYNGNVEWSED